MTSLGSIYPRPLLLSPLPSLLKPHESNLFFFPRNRHNLLIVKSSFNNFHIPELESATQDLFNRAEGFIYTLADAVVNSTTVADHVSVIEESKKNGDWLSGITGYMEFTLKVLKDGLSALHVPYSYGFAIILLTVIVKAATFPLTKKQVESAMAMRSLQPQVKAIQKLYAGDQERIQSEMARLYKVAGVNPLAGCLPTLATIPVWIGLYRALSNVADEGLLTEGFFWIPTLSGPTTIAARQSGSGISWLFPFVDGHPPLGWHDTLSYLVLPVLLVISQYISAQVIQPVQSNDANQKSAQAVTKFLPLIIGYFALSVPSGLSLYWFTNNVLSTAQQIWLQKLGGAKNPVKKFTDISYSDDTSEAEQSTSQIQKSLNVLDTGKVNSSPQVKAESNNLRRGDRFKQLKEQEARRRKQREEEKGQAEEKGRNRNSDVDSRIIEQNKSEDQILDKTNEKDSGDDLKVINSSSTENGRLHSRVGPQINGEGFQENRQEDQISEQHGPSSNLTPLDQREHESDDI